MILVPITADWEQLRHSARARLERELEAGHPDADRVAQLHQMLFQLDELLTAPAAPLP